MILIASADRSLTNLLTSEAGEPHGYLHCDSLSSAIRHVEDRRVRIVVVAEDLGDRHGFELLSYLQIYFPTIPTIYVADDSRKETVISAMRRGAKDFLESPVDRKSLIESIRRVGATYAEAVRIPGSVVDRPQKKMGAPSGKERAVPELGRRQRSAIEVSFFGSFKVIVSGRSIDHWPSRKGKSIFAYLIYNESRPIFREQLIDLFWPKVFPESARNCLNVTIHHVRQLFQKAGLKPSALLLSNDCYSINPDLRISTDVKRFLVHWNRFRFLRVDNRHSPAVNELELAASIYKGDFLQEDIYEEWAVPERENLREMYLEALENLSRIHSLNGKPKTAIEICKSILEKDDCREKVHRRLMMCYHRVGKRDHAIRQFKKCTDILKRELDVGPSVQTVELYRKIRDDRLPIRLSDES